MALPLALWGIERGQERLLACTTAAVTASTGLPVTIGTITPTLEPGIALDRVRLGSQLRLERVELALTFDGMRPKVAGVRLIGPEATLSLGDVARLVRASLPSVSNGLPGEPSDGLALPRLSAQDGRAALTLQLGGFPLSLDSQGIHLQPTDAGYRLVTGKSTIRIAELLSARLESFAADLDPKRSFHPTRLAGLAGELRIEGYPLALRVLQARASQQAGVLEARIDARAPGSGKVVFSARVHRAPRALAARSATAGLQHAQDMVRATLDNVGLTSLAPLLTRLGVDGRRATVFGTLTLSRMGSEQQLQADLRVKDLVLMNRRLSAQAIHLPALSLQLSVLRDPDGVWTLMDSRIGIPKLALHAQGSFDPRTERLSVALRLPPVGCQQTLMALPDALVPVLRGMRLAGELGGSLNLDFSLAKVEAGSVGVDLSPFSCRVLDDGPKTLSKSLLRAGPTQWVRRTDGGRQKRRLARGAPDYLPLHRISRHLRAAFVVAEDTHFFTHRGFDLPQIKRALLHNVAHRRVERGASTISQQVVKNLFLDHRRSLSRKLQEAVLTWRLEKLASKQRILELYLNLVEMGSGIYGVEQAARHYFDKSATSLTPLQAAHLAALTPSPRRLGPATPDAAWMERLQMILRMMWRAGYLPPGKVRRYSPRALGLKRKS